MTERAMLVRHPRLGEGKVIQTRHRGLEILVDFGNGLPTRWLRREMVQVLQTANRADPKPKDPTCGNVEAVPDPNSPMPERIMIESFRMGIVPHGFVDQFTFGRDAEIRQLHEWLEGECGPIVLVGEYGAGKTHLIDHAYSAALYNGFMVAKAEVDIHEAPFHKPKSLYRQLIGTLRFRRSRTQTVGFRRLVNIIAANTSELDGHKYLGPVIRHCRRQEAYTDLDLIWQWIEGHEVNYKSLGLPWLPDQGTAASIYTNILTALGWVSSNVLGLKGLVLLLDEAELVSLSANYSQFQRGENFVRGMLLASKSCETLIKESVVKRFVNSGFESRGQLTNLQYHGRRPLQMPFVYRAPSHTRILMAFTPIDAIDQPPLSGTQQIWIEPLDTRSRKEVFEGICELYRKAYDFRLPLGVREDGFREIDAPHMASTRDLTRETVHFLDYQRFNVVLE
jgi:hypothetical protein